MSYCYFPCHKHPIEHIIISFTKYYKHFSKNQKPKTHFCVVNNAKQNFIFRLNFYTIKNKAKQADLIDDLM